MSFSQNFFIIRLTDGLLIRLIPRRPPKSSSGSVLIAEARARMAYPGVPNELTAAFLSGKAGTKAPYGKLYLVRADPNTA
jgi:hypothetical protein